MKHKLIMESWRLFLEDQENFSEAPQTRSAAIVWNDPSYRPIKKLKQQYKILKTILPDYIPQGHAGVVLLKEFPKYLSIEAYDFGVGGTQCPKANPSGAIEVIAHKAGLFVDGGVRKRTSTKRFVDANGKNISFFDIEDKIPHIIEILKTNHLETSRAKELGYIPNINFDAAKIYANTPRCRLYTVVPHLAGSTGDNCGSFALKVAGAGMEKSPQSGKPTGLSHGISDNMIGPDQLLPALQKLGWAEVAMSFS
jgi:hypothetical protein